MTTDRQGNSLSGATAEAVKLFDQAVEAFNIYRGDPVALLDNALKVAPDFAMAHILKAHLFALATEPDATNEAKIILCKAKTLRLSDREASHIAALDLLVEGQWTAAAAPKATSALSRPLSAVSESSHRIKPHWCSSWGSGSASSRA